MGTVTGYLLDVGTAAVGGFLLGWCARSYAEYRRRRVRIIIIQEPHEPPSEQDWLNWERNGRG